MITPDILSAALARLGGNTWHVEEMRENLDVQYRCTPAGGTGLLTRSYDVDRVPDVETLAMQILDHKQRQSATYYQPSPEDIAARRAELAPFDGWNERAFAQIVAWQGIPTAYLDLGSGTGAMVNMARKMGIDAHGVDLINGPEHWFITHDLTQPLELSYSVNTGQPLYIPNWGRENDALDGQRLPVQFPLITCLEVAEHLHEDAAPVLVATIARHLESGGLLIFSAAPPGQEGEHHVNCQPARYWRSLFHEFGISYREDYTRQLSHLLGWVTGPSSHWLAANVQVLDK